MEEFALKVKVLDVELWSVSGTELDVILFDCGHSVTYDHDEANATLVGAETTCDRSHKVKHYTKEGLAT